MSNVSVTHPQFKMCPHAQDQSIPSVIATIQATHTDVLHPQFKMQAKVGASTLQNAPKDNSGKGPKCRLPQWLRANCEAFITKTTIILGYTIY